MNPSNLTEWLAYIETLSGPDLLSKALAANQVAFVRSLEGDGLPPQDIAAVFKGFATRLLADEQALPARVSGGYVDYGSLIYPADF